VIGINDAASLNQSDVGISVDSAVDIAKESADIILLEKDLMVLEEGVLEGRKTYGNLIKYIKMATSSNFGNMFSVLLASLFLPFLPILPIQILIQNILYDLSQLAIPMDNVDKEYILKPRKWNTKSVSSFMKYMGPVSSVFDVIVFFIMWYVFKANSLATQALFQTGWFVFGLVSQTMIVHFIRTTKIPFIQSRSSNSLLFSTGIIVVIAMILPYTWVGGLFGLVSLPGLYFAFLVGLIFIYAVFTQIIKKVYIKKYGEWI